MATVTEIRIRETEKAIGRDLAHLLSPVIVNKKGVIVDGKHRLRDDATWTKRTVPLNDFDTHRVRLTLNASRRVVETADYNSFAKFLRKTEPGKTPWQVKSGETIAARISKATGIPEDTVREYLHDDFKQKQKVGDTPTLGASEQVRVPKALVLEIKALVHQVKVSASETPEHRREVIRNTKSRLRDHTTDLSAASKMPPKLRRLVETSKLKLEVAKLIESKVPSKFIEDEARHIVDNRLNLEQAETYLISQEPSYKAHEIGEKLEESPTTVTAPKPEPPPSFFKLNEMKIRGRTEPDFNLENLELVTGSGKHIRFLQEILGALRKVSAGDEVEITVTIWATPKPKPIEAS